VTCWLCGKPRPCHCMADDLDELVDGEQGRPVDGGLWTADTASVYAQDDWLSERTALAGRHGHLREGAVLPISTDPLLARVLRSPSHAPPVPRFSWSWDQPDTDPVEDLRNAIAALSGRERRDEVIVIGGPAHGSAVAVAADRNHLVVPEDQVEQVLAGESVDPSSVASWRQVPYAIESVLGQRYALAPGWRPVRLGCSGEVSEELMVRYPEATSLLRRQVLSEHRAEAARLLATGAVALCGLEVRVDPDIPRDVLLIRTFQVIAVPPHQEEGSAHERTERSRRGGSAPGSAASRRIDARELGQAVERRRAQRPASG